MLLLIYISRDQYCTPNCGAKYVVITLLPFSFNYTERFIKDFYGKQIKHSLTWIRLLN